jgi:hypothetical protein
MDGKSGQAELFAEQTAYAFDIVPDTDTAELTTAERAAVIESGQELARHSDDGIWLLISGRFTSTNGQQGTETKVQELLRHAFGYPDVDNGPQLTLNVLLNSPGGSLDSAYLTTLYLSAYAKELRVYVPDRAKSASTLLAVGADQVLMSAFAELGPLDTQIPDPRNPANTVSALDCYQSVDYVRDFGVKTITEILPQLVNSTERRIPIDALLETGSTFALGAITPVLRTVTALDFGGWGRSLRIGEHYARKLLQARTKVGDQVRAGRIAHQLVYGYTHHLFPIDHHEARRIGLNVEQMDKDVFDRAAAVVDACHKKDFVGFLGKAESELDSAPAPVAYSRQQGRRQDEHPQAEVGSTLAWNGRDADADSPQGGETE